MYPSLVQAGRQPCQWLKLLYVQVLWVSLLLLGNLRIEGELTSLSKFRSGSDMFYLDRLYHGQPAELFVVMIKILLTTTVHH